MNTKDKGDYAEALFIAKAIKKGYVVSVPTGDNAPYDCILDVNGSLKKVQVKGRYSKEEGSVLIIPLQSSRNYINKKQYHYTEVVDYLAVVDLGTDQVYLLDMSDDCFNGKNIINLRLKVAKNNNTKLVNLAEDYRF